ncbi:hypothetical protein LXM56_15685 [Lysinibacillus fusiformis]|uniref:hypothetical protein n=1 Tax=Lysinibacillus fusiformis TaxID=28031 RepID=UPI001E6126A7|nr:hypothetical protein [Lysinibacillus fusiformis]MCE4045557.1 hypothetical protein [Lysinibacillus fusiformis]
MKFFRKMSKLEKSNWNKGAPLVCLRIFGEENSADNPARLSSEATQSLRYFKPFGFVDTLTLGETLEGHYKK